MGLIMRMAVRATSLLVRQSAESREIRAGAKALSGKIADASGVAARSFLRQSRAQLPDRKVHRHIALWQRRRNARGHLPRGVAPAFKMDQAAVRIP